MAKHEVMLQKFCKVCGGIKKMKDMTGKVIDPMKYPDYGVAADAGCICEKKNKKKEILK